MPRPKSRTLKLKLAEIPADLLPAQPQRSGLSAYHTAVSQLLRRLFRELGGVIESIALTSDQVTVLWQPPYPIQNPVDPIVRMLTAGEYQEAALLSEFLLTDDPDNTGLLYNLGMAYSDLGRLDRALPLLRRLLALEPHHVNGRVAVGVALTRQQKYAEAEGELRQALGDDPNNPWAHRNLGGCLLNLNRAEEAIVHLQRAAELNPSDERAWYGLAQAQEVSGDTASADETYQRVIQMTEVGDIAELARQARSRIAGETFREAMPGMPRMDAVMYCLGALERFANMSPAEVYQVGAEIAILGMNGINVNDPDSSYHLRSLPGEFSGLHLLSLEYVAFKQAAPELNIGFDLAREYEMAQTLYTGRKAGRPPTTE